MTSLQAQMVESLAPASGDDRFRLAMLASGVGMAVVDLDGRWQEVNPAMERLFGYKARDMIGQPASSFTHPDDLEASSHYLHGLVDGTIPMLDAAKRYLHRDGHVLWVHVNVAVVRDADARPLYLLAQLRDVSAERAVESALQSRADAERMERDHSHRQLQLFADAVAHDLRAPLRSIESFSALLADRASNRLDDTDLDYLGRIRGAAQRMAGLLSALSDLSYVTRTDLRLDDVDLSLLAEWTGAELQDANPGRAAQIDVQDAVRVQGDERMLKMLLAQLFDNAWKFSSSRERVQIKLSAETGDNRTRISIRDHGSGFDMRYVHKLFEPFQRLHGPDQGGGHGLGLAIAQRVAERHGGRIRAEATPGEGALFVLDLPADRTEPAT